MRWFQLLIFLTLMVLGFFLRGCSDQNNPPPPNLTEENKEISLVQMISITPSKVPSFGGVFVSIKGKGFKTTSKVSFNKMPSKRIDFVSDEEISVLVPANAGSVGKISVEIVNEESSKTNVFSNNQLLSYYLTDIEFGGNIPIPNIISPSVVTALTVPKKDAVFLIADQTNKTGTSDLYQYSFNLQNNMFDSKLIGTFDNRIVVLSPIDINSDGNTDLAIGLVRKDIVLYIDDGAGDLFKYNTLTTTDTKIRSLFFEDFDGNGFVDIGVIVGNNVTSFLNKNMMFVPTKSSPAGILPLDATPIDFNQDGFKDLLVTDSGRVLFLQSNRNGTFQIPSFSNAFDDVSQLLKTDLNGDFSDDLLILTQNATGLMQSVLNEKGIFANSILNSIPQETFLLFPVDINMDGIIDVIANLNSTDDKSVAVLLGTGDGTFLAPEYFPILAQSDIQAIADFNHDQKLDLVVATYNMGIKELHLFLNLSQ